MSKFGRREFIKRATAAAVATTGLSCASESPVLGVASSPVPGKHTANNLTQQPLSGKVVCDTAQAMSVGSNRKAVKEAPRLTPVVTDVDVLVVGGGPTGVGAALAAAGEGARTLVIERYGMLGGMWTAGLLNPLFDAKGKGYLVAKLIDRLEQAGAWMKWKFSYTYDTEVMKFVLEQMMAEARAQFQYYSMVVDTIVEDGRVRGVIVESKSGRQAILAKATIDCSGDGDAAARAGVPYRVGRMGDGLAQPMTLMFEVTGVGRFHMDKSEAVYDLMVEAIKKHNLDVQLPFRRVGNVPWVIHVPRTGAADVQASHVYQINPLDAGDLTRATVETRRQIHDLLKVMRHIPDMENIQLTQTAATLGVRESRHIQGQYTLTLDDLQAGRDFPDAVTFCKFGVDIHNIKAPGEADDKAHPTGTLGPRDDKVGIRPYSIPYRCLLPVKVRDLIVAGRCISGSHEAHASYRVTGTCMAMGQAAGLAAAMSVANGHSPDKLDGAKLKQALRDRGARMLQG